MNWLAPAGVVIGALVTALFAFYGTAWKLRRESRLDTARALRLTRDPLLRAAFDLQSRCYNIVAQNLLTAYLERGNRDERDYVVSSTLWILGQYLGWVEILRREVQYLDLGSGAVNRTLQLRLSNISDALASDAVEEEQPFMVFRADQRAIGEFMVTRREVAGDTTRPDCLGYSEFIERLQTAVEESRRTQTGPRQPIIVYAERCAQDLENAAGDSARALRLVKVQRRLIDLIDILDSDRLRYPDMNLRGKLPLSGATEQPPPLRVGGFLWRGEPWTLAEQWASHRALKTVSKGDASRTFEGRSGPTRKRLRVLVDYDEDHDWVTISASVERRKGSAAIDGALRTTRARLAVNELLSHFDRPLIAHGSTLPCRVAASAAALARRLASADARR